MKILAVWARQKKTEIPDAPLKGPHTDLVIYGHAPWKPAEVSGSGGTRDTWEKTALHGTGARARGTATILYLRQASLQGELQTGTILPVLNHLLKDRF